jgi:hypothetical protein
MPSNPTYPGPFSHTWDEREPRGPARTGAEYDEPIELPLVRRWPAVVVASALIVALGAGLLLIQRSFSRVSLGPTEELPMQPREFESSLAVSPAWIRAQSETATPPTPPLSAPESPAPAPPQRLSPVLPRRGTPPPDREPRAFAPPPVTRPETREREQPQGFDFGSADSLRPPDDPALDPNDLAPRDEPSAARPVSDDMPDADAPDADIPDGGVPDADVPDAEPPGDGEGNGDPDYSPIIGF